MEKWLLRSARSSAASPPVDNDASAALHTATGSNVVPASEATALETAASAAANTSVKRQHKGPWNRSAHSAEYRTKMLETFAAWLRYDQEHNVLYCAPCREAYGSENTHRSWAHGVKDGRSWDKDKLKMHGELASHMHAVGKTKHRPQVALEKSLQVQMNIVAGRKSQEMCADRLALESLLFLVLRNRPLSDLPQLLDFNHRVQSIQNGFGLSTSDALRLREAQNWTNRGKIAAGVCTLAKQISEDAFAPMKTSPYWAFLWDLKGDISRTEKGSLYIRHLDSTGNRAVNTFVCNCQVPETTAEAEWKLVVEKLETLSLNGIGIAAGLDGAKVNFGSKSGIVKRSGVLGVHCTPHKINLTLVHLDKGIEIVGQLREHLREIAKDLWTSPKRTEMWHQVQAELGEGEEEFLYAPRTRWFYVVEVLQRYVNNLPVGGNKKKDVTQYVKYT